MRNTILPLFLILFSGASIAQLSSTFNQTLNYNCLGQPCNYEGPTILINELMIHPTVNDGSISGPGTGQGRGEWIELYNPNLCEPVDISCYYLGNYTVGGFTGTGGVRLPENLIVPPGGFVMVRGFNVAPVPANLLVQNGGNVIEVVVPPEVWNEGVCSSSGRVWFPNAGGWFAFYDADGVPQDAVSWASAAGVDFEPCIPSTGACTSVASLPSYGNIPADRKNYTVNSTTSGNSIRRIPDGGAWAGSAAPTYATCNSLPCATVGESTCTGTATVNVTGGQPPYSYLWNDSQLQMTPTATGLCEGTYTVVVTDDNGISESFSVEIENYVPEVTLNVANEYCPYDGNVDLVNYTPVPNANQVGDIVGQGVNNFVFSPNDAGVGTHALIYTFTDENGCTNSAQDEIVVHPIPEITLNVTNAYCANDVPVQISNFTPPTNGPLGSGTISGPGISLAGLNNIFFTPQAAGPGVHTITYDYTSIHGCVNSVTNEITVYAIPNVDINVANAYCVYDPDVDITMTTEPTTIGANGSGVISGPGVTANGNSFFFNPETAGPGTHTITYTYTTDDGCINTATDQIIVHDIPVIDFTANPIEAFVPSNVTFTNNTLGNTNFMWYFGNGDSLQSNANQVQYLYNEIGNYTVVLFGEANGCENWDSLAIAVISPILYDFPNVFSPNGDNENPFFNLINVAGIEKVATFELIILNRWGNVLKVFEDPFFTWDGKTNDGSDATEGVYFYKLYMTSAFDDVFENHGFFHLIR